ncbi:MAG: hypothetical protein LBJ97_04280 [Mycoplasmataceae bacterium]|jgi:hypothetical protein|nr:hypothetical protein [Mycoplasmataceae bacterium]
MSKIKVSMTLVMTKTLAMIVEAIDLEDATQKALKSAKREEWVSKSELKTNAK